MIHRERQEKLKEDCKAFNSKIKVPVKWKAAYKMVLSGLTLNSWGDGAKKNTVNHILLEEDLEDGRLKRKAGDILCSPSNKGKVGVAESFPEHSKINCKKCLAIAKRKGWLK